MALKVGKNIDGWCTRCKLVLGHTIEAIAGGKITRVHCNTCGGQHAHRVEAPRTRVAAERAPGGGGGSRASKEQVKRESEYDALLRGRTKAASRPYSTSTRFAVGELISHATFGLGVVTGERDSIKIDILFANGPKVLLQGR
ncbi:MAG: hypothetical protein HY271_01165 [Deltaproteobacteria bacterium]|nr:hypothetical protein [Deltaproteobacteria bacterium]